MQKKLQLGKADIKPMDPKDVKKIRGGDAAIDQPGDSFSVSASASGSLSLGYAETDVEVEVEAEAEF
jgi:hypothetical protein